jgi:hypothetical protein
MHLLERFGFYVLLSCFAIAFQPLHVAAQQTSVSPKAGTGSARDGQHDSDFEIGTWKTHLTSQRHRQEANASSDICAKKGFCAFPSG